MPLGGPDELAPHIDDMPVGQAVVQHPPADPVPRLEDEHAGSRPLQLPGCGQARQAGAHHHDIGFGATGHALSLYQQAPNTGLACQRCDRLGGVAVNGATCGPRAPVVTA